MDRDLFWLTDEQFEKSAAHLPRDTRGKPRLDDHRVISGILHVLKSGGRWIDAPPEYGPKKTLYTRYVRWAAKGVRSRLVLTLSSGNSPPPHVIMDRSAVKAHRAAKGEAAGRRSQTGRVKSGRRPLTWCANDENPCSD